MIKFKITTERCLEAASVPEYIGAITGNIGAQMKILPKFLINDDGEYLVQVVLDDDGDILECKNLNAAMDRMNSLTPARFEKLRKEVAEAFKNIVNPPKGEGSKPRSSPESKQPPAG